MVAVPAAIPVARPLALIVATGVLEDVQVIWLVTFWVLPSENVPVAVNCSVPPVGRLGLAGVTAIEVSAGATVMLNGLVAVCMGLLASLTCTVVELRSLRWLVHR